MNKNTRKLDWVYRLILKGDGPYSYRTQFFFSMEDLRHYLLFTNEEVVEIASATVGDFYRLPKDFRT